jgi:hypothetical protein
MLARVAMRSLYFRRGRLALRGGGAETLSMSIFSVLLKTVSLGNTGQMEISRVFSGFIFRGLITGVLRVRGLARNLSPG